jgi:HAD superfamily hydrolase (TIGR01549 family)
MGYPDDMIRAVLFDLGDTLWHFPAMPPAEVRTARSAERVEALLRAWGLRDGVDCTRLADAIREAEWRETLAAYQSHCRSPHFPTLVQEVAAAHGLPLTAAQAEELWYAWNLGGIALGRELFPDSVPTLRALRRRGFRLGTVTNRSLGGPPFREELRQHDMLDLFETFAISCDDGWLKPAPQIFRKALDELGVRPEEAVMVGDSLRADVAGAKALGMIAVWKRPPNPVAEDARLPDGSPAVPDFVVDHLGELLQLPILRR